MFCVFRSNHHCSWKFHKFHWKTPALESLFFLRITKLSIDICSAWLSHTFAEIFLIDWCHAHIKNTIDLLLFYGEHFYGYSEIDYENVEKKKFISQQTYLYIQSKTFWNFMKFYFVHIVKVCSVFKKTVILPIFSVYA